MKKGFCVGLCLALLAALCGCSGDAGAAMMDSIRGDSMQFTVNIAYGSDGSVTKRLMGEGSVTGLLGEDMLLALEYETHYSQKVTANNPIPGLGSTTYSQGSSTNHNQLHYRAGTFYIAKAGLGMDDDPDPVSPEEVRAFTPSETLLRDLLAGTAPAGSVSNISLEDGALGFDIALSSELGRMISELVAAVENNGDAAGDQAIRATITAGADGRPALVEILVKRATFVKEYEINLRIVVNSYGDVEPIPLPTYAR